MRIETAPTSDGIKGVACRGDLEAIFQAKGGGEHRRAGKLQLAATPSGGRSRGWLEIPNGKMGGKTVYFHVMAEKLLSRSAVRAPTISRYMMASWDTIHTWRTSCSRAAVT